MLETALKKNTLDTSSIYRRRKPSVDDAGESALVSSRCPDVSTELQKLLTKPQLEQAQTHELAQLSITKQLLCTHWQATASNLSHHCSHFTAFNTDLGLH